MLLYCEPETSHAVREALTNEGLRETSFEFDLTGACVITEVAMPQPELVSSHG